MIADGYQRSSHFANELALSSIRSGTPASTRVEEPADVT